MNYSWEDYGIGKVGECIFLEKIGIKYFKNRMKEAFKKVLTSLNFPKLITWFSF